MGKPYIVQRVEGDKVEKVSEHDHAMDAQADAEALMLETDAEGLIVRFEAIRDPDVEHVMTPAGGS